MPAPIADPTDARRALFEAVIEDHPDDVARELERAPLPDAVALVSRYPRPAQWVVVLGSLSTERSARLLEALPSGVARDIVEAMEAPAAAALVARVDEDARVALLGGLSRETRSELHELLSFPPESAGRIMDPHVLAFVAGATVSEVLDRLRTASWRRANEVFVVGTDGTLEGQVPLQEVVLAPPETRLRELAHRPPAVIPAVATREEVVELLENKKLPVIPVVDVDGRLLGAMRTEELMTAAQEEASADMLTMVGASREERALSRVSFAVRKRLPWLQINLATAFLAASVVGLFESTIERFTALAVLLPIVAGQSGNTGAQALAVVMRGLALREIRIRQGIRVLSKELMVGLVNGIAVAATTSFFVLLWSRSVGLAAIIGLSMVLSMTIAGLAGGAVPLALTALGQDPAQSSSIVLTTVTDVVGFSSFLGIATLLSGLL
jgi:magnesium transporter